MAIKNKQVMTRFRRKKEALRPTNDLELAQDLDKFSMKLIKVVGVFGILAGMLILIAFWYWVFKLLYKLG